MRIMVSLTKIKSFLEKRQLWSKFAQIPFFEHLCSLKEWWRHDHESYSWIMKNNNLNQDLTTAEKRKIWNSGPREKSVFYNFETFFQEFWYGYGILKCKSSMLAEYSDIFKSIFWDLWTYFLTFSDTFQDISGPS